MDVVVVTTARPMRSQGAPHGFDMPFCQLILLDLSECKKGSIEKTPDGLTRQRNSVRRANAEIDCYRSDGAAGGAFNAH